MEKIGTVKMKFNYCGKVFNCAHQTCILKHVLKLSGDLDPCIGKILQENQKQYIGLYTASNKKKNKKR